MSTNTTHEWIEGRTEYGAATQTALLGIYSATVERSAALDRAGDDAPAWTWRLDWTDCDGGECTVLGSGAHTLESAKRRAVKRAQDLGR